MPITILIPAKIRRPSPGEGVVFNPALELTTRLLPHKTSPEAMDTEYYLIINALRGPIRDERNNVRVFVYYSLAAKAFALWIVKITLSNTWYESIAHLFDRSADFFSQNKIRINSKKSENRYRARALPFDRNIAWPTISTNELLGKAMGADHFVRSRRWLYFWGKGPGLRSFFDAHADDLFVAHNAVAEMKYLTAAEARLEIKSSIGMDQLRCKSPEMATKEIWTC